MIALRPTSRANGALEVLRGSHKAGRLEHGQVGQRLDQVGAETRRVELLAEHCPLTPMEMEPGSLLFFHCNLVSPTTVDLGWECCRDSDGPTFPTYSSTPQAPTAATSRARG